MNAQEGRLISSKITVVYKFILPALWISLFGLGTFAAFHGSDSAPPPEKWILLIVWLVGSAMWYLLCIPLKKVLIDGEDLIISNYAREIRVPLNRIRRVSASRFVSPPSVKMVFDGDYGFGASVSFMPTQIFLWPWQEHPIAKQLRHLSGTN